MGIISCGYGITVKIVTSQSIPVLAAHTLEFKRPSSGTPLRTCTRLNPKICYQYGSRNLFFKAFCSHTGNIFWKSFEQRSNTSEAERRSAIARLLTLQQMCSKQWDCDVTTLTLMPYHELRMSVENSVCWGFEAFSIII